VCRRVPPRTSHRHTPCKPPFPISALIRIRPGQPLPWAQGPYITKLCKLGAGRGGDEARWNRLLFRRLQRLRQGGLEDRPGLQPAPLASGPTRRGDRGPALAALLSSRLHRCARAACVPCSYGSAVSDQYAPTDAPDAHTWHRFCEHNYGTADLALI